MFLKEQWTLLLLLLLLLYYIYCCVIDWNKLLLQYTTGWLLSNQNVCVARYTNYGSRTFGGSVGNSHAFIHPGERTVATLLPERMQPALSVNGARNCYFLGNPQDALGVCSRVFFCEKSRSLYHLILLHKHIHTSPIQLVIRLRSSETSEITFVVNVTSNVSCMDINF